MCQYIPTLFFSYHKLKLISVTVTTDCIICQRLQQILTCNFKSMHNIQQLHKVDLFNHITSCLLAANLKKLTISHFITVRYGWLKSSTQCPEMYTHLINIYKKYSRQTLINCFVAFSNISNAWNVHKKHQRNVDIKKRW